jgi:hypothetical protein
MTSDNEPSKFQFWGIRITFKNEPIWYRLTLIAFALLVLFFIILLVKEWIITGIIADKISSIKLSGLFKSKSI